MTPEPIVRWRAYVTMLERMRLPHSRRHTLRLGRLRVSVWVERPEWPPAK